jgi:tryptophan-rich sensory protein
MALTTTGSRDTVREALQLVAAVGLCEAAGGAAGALTAESVSTWYPTLRKPSYTPPGWVFGPVWTLLYLLMGVALFLVWRGRATDGRVRGALGVFALQLALNVIWSLLFFRLRSPGSALVEILALWAAILLTVLAFGRVSRTAALLLVPYLLWVSFAAVLNLSIWRLN